MGSDETCGLNCLVKIDLTQLIDIGEIEKYVKPYLKRFA